MPDLNIKPWSYSLTGRRPAVRLALYGSLAVTAVALWQAAPWWVFLFVLLALGLSLRALLRTPVHGTSLSIEGWRFVAPGADRLIPLARIDHVTITPEAGGPDTVTLHLTDGSSFRPPPLCLPTAEALRPELARARIAVR